MATAELELAGTKGPSEPVRHARASKMPRAVIQSTNECQPIIESVISAMAKEGYSDRDRMAVYLAIMEGIVNAVKHGNRGDRRKHVTVDCGVDGNEVFARIEDQGAGFDPGAVPDPRDPANCERPSGRGLLLMRTHMTSVRFNERGNCVTMCKRRSA